MNRLFPPEQEDGNCCETQAPDYEKKFCRLLAADIAADLQIPYSSRDIVVPLLSTCIERRLCNRDGMLEGYLHSQLNIIAGSLRQKFNIEDDVKVNYNYATHAKFNDILSAIQENHDKKVPKEDPYFGG